MKMKILRSAVAWAFVAMVILTATVIQPADSYYWDTLFPFERVMDELALKRGQVVADIGCQEGFLTFDLAHRVGPNSIVYAVDIDPAVLAVVTTESERMQLRQIRVIHSDPKDPMLPAGELDVAIIANAYHEMRFPAEMLSATRRALRQRGQLAIIERDAEDGHPRDNYYELHKVPKPVVVREARKAGFTYIREVRPVRQGDFYFLIFKNL
ncbi:MAG: methyltransferase domain-containing protein [Candidatus Doudnabacteria bacterium]|nr:methyltransferase domain-containing protein [Candidatus Doudnabacteria bacterium]